MITEMKDCIQKKLNFSAIYKYNKNPVSNHLITTFMILK